MLNFDDLVVGTNNKEPENLCIVRVTTDYWSDSKGLYSKKSIKFLKRKCKGYSILQEDCSNIGAEEVFLRIENLNDVEDGIYEVIITNEQRDWESGYIEDYDYHLTKYTKLNKE